MTISILRWLIGQLRSLGEVLRMAFSDEEVRRLMYAAVGLPQDSSPPPGTTWNSLNDLDRYLAADDDSLAGYQEAADVAIVMFRMLRDHIEAIKREAGVAETAHLLLRDMVGWLTLPMVRQDYPRLYFTMRALGMIEETLNVHLSEVVSYGQIEAAFRSPGTFTSELFCDRYRLGTEEEAKLTSDLSLLPLAGVLLGGALLKAVQLPVQVLYGWTPLPESPTPRADTIAARTLSAAWTLTLRDEEDGDTDELPVGLTAAWIPRPHGGPALLVSVVAGEARGRLGERWRLRLDTGGLTRFSLLLPPIGGDEEVDLDALGATEAASELTVERAGDPVPDLLVLGDPEGTRLEVGGFAAVIGYRLRRSGGGSNVQFRARLAAQRARLVVAAGDAGSVVGEAIRRTGLDQLQIEFDLALVVELGPDGVRLRLAGGSSVNAVLPVDRTVGPLTITHVTLSLSGARVDDSPELVLSATAALVLEREWLTLRFDGLGLEWDLRSLRGIGFRAPASVGVALDLGPVSGGGYLLLDRDQQRYAAILSLEVAEFFIFNRGFEVTAVVVTGAGDDGRDFFALLGVEWEPWPIGLGFTLNGIGGILADERGVDLAVLQAGLRDRTLDAVLFPQRPVAEAPALVATLARAFPRASGQSVLGLMVKFGWGTPNVLTGTLAVLYERPAPRRFILLGQIAATITVKGRTIVDLRLALVGHWHPDASETALDGTLQGSRIAGLPVSGDGAWRSQGGDERGFLFSVGGFHPCFEAPMPVPALRRLSLALTDRDNPRVRFLAYFALSTNTLQAGGRVEAVYAKAGFSLEGVLGLDLLLDRAQGTFCLDVAARFTIRRGRTTIASVEFTGALSGTSPWRLRGKAKLKVLFFSVSFSVDVSTGSEAPPPELEPARARQRLLAALRDPRSWRADPPPSGRTVVSLRPPAPEPGIIHAHPLAPLAVSQGVLPLEATIDHIGTAPLDRPERFSLTEIQVGDLTVAHPQPETDYFAPAEYFALSDTEKLTRPSFERLRSGVRFSVGGTTHGPAVTAPMGSETVVIDATGRRHRRHRHPFTRLLLALAARLAEANRTEAEAERFEAPANPVVIEEPRYTVASTTDLRSAEQPELATVGSYTERREALERHVRDHPQQRGRLQLIGVHEGALP